MARPTHAVSLSTLTLQGKKLALKLAGITVSQCPCREPQRSNALAREVYDKGF